MRKPAKPTPRALRRDHDVQDSLNQRARAEAALMTAALRLVACLDLGVLRVFAGPELKDRIASYLHAEEDYNDVAAAAQRAAGASDA